MSDRAMRILQVGGVTGALVLAWPAFSDAWNAFLGAIVSAVSDGRPVYGPPTASPTLVAVIVMIVALPLSARRRFRFATATMAAALAAELLAVVAGVALSVPASYLPILGGIAQDAVPAVMLLMALSAANETARDKRHSTSGSAPYTGGTRRKNKS